MKKNITVYQVPAGYGRTVIQPDGMNGEVILVHCLSEVEGTPNKNTWDWDDPDDWMPIFGIRLTDPRTALAWARYFKQAARIMKRNKRIGRKIMRKEIQSLIGDRLFTLTMMDDTGDAEEIPDARQEQTD